MYLKWTLHSLLLNMDERESIYQNIETCDSVPEGPHTYITVLGDSSPTYEDGDIYEEVDTNSMCDEKTKCNTMLSTNQFFGNVLHSGNDLKMKSPNRPIKVLKTNEAQERAEKRLSRYISEEEYVTPNVPEIQLEECCVYGNVSDEDEPRLRVKQGETMRAEIETLYGNCVQELYHLQGRFLSL